MSGKRKKKTYRDEYPTLTRIDFAGLEKNLNAAFDDEYAGIILATVERYFELKDESEILRLDFSIPGEEI